MKRAFAVIFIVALAGCALGPGEPFATLDAGFKAAYRPLFERFVDGVFEKLSSDFQVQLTRAELKVDEVVLLQGSGATASFDPAKPPPGYGLCHGGHCHRDDGALVSYEEIEAELAGGSAGLTTAVVMPVGTRDLLEGKPVRLSCEPSCDLPMGTIRRAEAHASTLVLEGVVRDGRAGQRIPETRFRLETSLTQAEGVLGVPLDLAIDRHLNPEISFALLLEVTAKVFDGVDWAALEVADGELDLRSAANRHARDAIVTGLGDAELSVLLERYENESDKLGGM